VFFFVGQENPDMVKKVTTYLWQMPSGIDAGIFHAAAVAPVPSRIRSASGHILGNKAGRCNPPSADASEDCVFATRTPAGGFSRNETTPPLPRLKQSAALRHPRSGHRQHQTYRHGYLRIHAGFFVFGHIPVVGFSAN